jgi:branched-chain amino acid transport system permease protein
MSQLLDYLSLPLTMFAIFGIQAMSLQLILGGAGLLSFGHAAYFAVGGYVSAAVTVFGLPALGIDPALHPLTSLLVAALTGMLASGLTGFLVALPCLRLQGDYLAMATLGFGEIVMTILKNVEVVGGTRGFKDIPRLTHPVALWISVGLVALFLHRFYASPWGFAVRATRDDEIAARSLGVSTSRAKLLAFAVGTGLAGLAGAFHAHALQFISPDAAGFDRSVEILLAVVLGGMYSLHGSLFGAFILVSLPEVLRFAPAGIAEKRVLFFSLAVIILMILNPRGLTSILERLVRRKPPRNDDGGPALSAGPSGGSA